jgi:16S rRNA (guanine966-N2)-methyltransferase
MRVIAGTLGGRQFDSPRGHRTHPMSDKVRGAIFNILGDIEGLTALDAFAGSGALGFEALSREAAHVTAIEVDITAYQTIVRNAQMLGLSGHMKIIRANCSSWSDHNPDLRFDIVLCDPPYDQLQPQALTKMAQHVANDGTLVLSWPGGQEPPSFIDLTVLTRKSYGDAQLIFYKHTI